MLQCPKTEYSSGYWIETMDKYAVYKWKITGGFFKDHFGQLKDEIIIYKTEIYSTYLYVSVIWNNIPSKDGKAPKGTVSIDTYKNETIQDKYIIGSGKREQEIKSLNDIIPPSLTSNAPTSPQIDFGMQGIKVSFTGPFYYPGIKNNGNPVPVTQFEWKIPGKWKAQTGSKTSSGTYLTSDPEIKLETDASSGGEVMVRGVNDCAGSGDYSVYSFPLTFTRATGIEFLKYPQTVPLGIVETYDFSVLSIQGVTFEWRAPSGWSINGGGNTYSGIGANAVRITTKECPTNEKVRVRLAQGNNISEWAVFPTVVELPAIKSPPGEIKQYQSTSFSLDMPDDNIASTEWFVNDVSVGTATNTSSLAFVINESGKVRISAKVTLSGCPAVSIPKIEVNVEKAPDPIISGPTLICDQATYTVINLPQGATVEWSASKLNIIGGQGTPSVTVQKNSSLSSSVSVQATITMNGGNTITVRKNNIQAGTLAPNILLCTVDDKAPGTVGAAVSSGITGTLYWLYAKGISSNASDYIWRLYPSDPFLLPVQQPGQKISFQKNTPGNYLVSLQYNGECGWSDEIFSTIRIE